MKIIKWILSTAIVAMAISCQPPAAEQPAEQPAAAAPDHSALVNSFLAAMDANDSTALFANCSADFVMHHPDSPTPLDRAAFMKHVRDINTALSGTKHTAVETISTANAAASRGTVAGKHTGTFNGIPASNNDVNVDWISFATVDANGKISALHVQFNQVVFMTQLGVKLPGS